MKNTIVTAPGFAVAVFASSARTTAGVDAHDTRKRSDETKARFRTRLFYLSVPGDCEGASHGRRNAISGLWTMRPNTTRSGTIVIRLRLRRNRRTRSSSGVIAVSPDGSAAESFFARYWLGTSVSPGLSRSRRGSHVGNSLHAVAVRIARGLRTRIPAHVDLRGVYNHGFDGRGAEVMNDELVRGHGALSQIDEPRVVGEEEHLHRARDLGQHR